MNTSMSTFTLSFSVWPARRAESLGVTLLPLPF